MNIKEIRKLNKLSQDKLAALLGVAPYTVRRWESGKSKPSPLAQEKLDILFNNGHQTGAGDSAERAEE